MGIEYFFNSLKLNKNTNLNDDAIGTLTSINVNYLYIDFNAIVYQSVNAVEYEFNKLLVKLIFGISDDEEIVKKIAILYDIDLENFTPDIYESLLDKKKITNIILNKINYNIYKIISKSTGLPLEYFFDDSILFTSVDVKLEKIMIAIDGIPQMSKIVEQRKRKYMNHIINEIKHSIKETYFKDENTYIISDKRKLFEKYKKSGEQIKDIVWGNIFNEIEKQFLNSDYSDLLKKKIPTLREYIVSPSNIPGEGEKKIMQNIIESNKSGNYSVFSPDGDMIVLMMIVQTILSTNGKNFNCNVIRLAYDYKCPSQDTVYNFINILKLSKNIIDYVIRTIENNDINYLGNVRNDNIIMDIATLITMFGNDFVPRIESINPINDISTIMKIYCNTIIQKPSFVKDVHIVRKIVNTDNKINYEINCNNFIDFMYKFSQFEGKLLRETYMINTYKNYTFLKSLFNSIGLDDLLYDLLLKYVEFTNKNIPIIENKILSNDEKINSILVTDSDYKFIKVFMMIEDKDFNIKESIISTLSNQELIVEFTKFIEKNNNFRPRLRLVEYDRELNSKYHELNIIQKMADINIEITEYDKEIYSFERKLGKWDKIFGSTKMDLGTFNIKSKIYPTKGYNIISRPVLEEVKSYYKDLFHIDDIKTEKGNCEVNEICKDYVKGLFWTFNFYFNMNNSEKNYNTVSTWSYKYKRAPLLTQIIGYFNSHGKGIRMELENIIKNDLNQYVDRENYFTKTEHYLYITPMKKILSCNDLEKYKNFVTLNNEFYMDTEDFINKIKLDDQLLNIDSKRISFLNKININDMKHIEYEKFVHELKALNIKEKNIIERQDIFHVNWN